MSGHGDGTVCIFRLQSGNLNYKYKAHERAVSGLQANPSVIISCGLDMTVKIADSTIGSVLRILDGGHKASIISVCFDSQRILSVDADGKMAFWPFRTNNEIGDKHDRIYRFKDGDTLMKISSKYNVTIDNLITWNNLPLKNQGLHNFAIGQEIIVKKTESPYTVGTRKARCVPRKSSQSRDISDLVH